MDDGSHHDLDAVDNLAPSLTARERAALLESLATASRDMAAGDYVVLTPGKLIALIEPHLTGRA